MTVRAVPVPAVGGMRASGRVTATTCRGELVTTSTVWALAPAIAASVLACSGIAHIGANAATSATRTASRRRSTCSAESCGASTRTTCSQAARTREAPTPERATKARAVSLLRRLARHRHARPRPMTWVAASLVVVVATLSIFVVGLLRSFADVARRLGDLERAEPRTRAEGEQSAMPDGVLPLATSVSTAVLSDIRGYTTTLEPITIELAQLELPFLLLAFLSTSCFSCLDIWRDVIAEGDGARVITASPEFTASLAIVLKDRETENLGKARLLAADTQVPVIFAGSLWEE